MFYIEPLQLTFYRQSMWRFVFSNLPLSSVVPGEVIDLDLMHPMVGSPVLSCIYISKGRHLEVSSVLPRQNQGDVGGVNPYEAYKVDVQYIESTVSSEVGIDFSSAGGRRRMQVVAKYHSQRFSGAAPSQRRSGCPGVSLFRWFGSRFSLFVLG